ncbi:uncharacterized protein [Hetaerina americana]|uniref:uncharacterized protein isoform X2 n=1 Tax=Hetaerina americana TaxID=62018 RepID=UPI003A7F2C77
MRPESFPSTPPFPSVRPVGVTGDPLGRRLSRAVVSSVAVNSWLTPSAGSSQRPQGPDSHRTPGSKRKEGRRTMERRRLQQALGGEDSSSGQPAHHHRPAATRGFRILRGRLPFPSLLLPSLVFLFVSILLLPPQLIAQPLQPSPQTQLRQQRPSNVASQAATRHLTTEPKATLLRLRRQSEPQEGLWQLYLRLMREGNNDTVSAFQQIRQLFSTLIEPERPRENVTTTEMASVTAEAGVEGEDVDGASVGANETLTTTTTEPTPRKISTGELMGIFRRNVFGLGRLFGREFWNAIQSNKNIEMYTKEWQDAIRPFVQ